MKKYIKPEIESLTLSTESMMLDTLSVVGSTNGVGLTLRAKDNSDAYPNGGSVWDDDDEE